MTIHPRSGGRWKRPLRALAGLGLLLLGAAVLLGERYWPAWLDQHAAALCFTGLNVASGFVLAGLALLPGGRRSRLQAGAGLALAALAAGGLLQQATGRWPAAPGWRYLLNRTPTEMAAWPGQMDVNTALALLLAGASLLLLAAPRRHGVSLLAQGLIVSQLGLALLGLSSALLGNILFFGQGPDQNLVSLPTALGLLVLGLGLYARLAASRWHRAFYRQRQHLQVFAASLALFTTLALLTGLCSIAIIGDFAMQAVRGRLDASFRYSAGQLEDGLQNAYARNSELLAQSALPQLLQARAGGAALQAALQAELARLMAAAPSAEILALRLSDGAGRVLAEQGAPAFSPGPRAAVAAPVTAHLSWQDGWRLTLELPLQVAGRRIATVSSVVGLRRFEARFREVNASGRSSEARLCAGNPAQVLCFPSRFQPGTVEYRLTPLATLRRNPAVLLAANGKRGVTGVLDYRGKNALAAYGPINQGALLLVHKVDTAECYAPLLRQLWLALGGLLSLILAGAGLLFWHTRPLVRRLISTSARLDAILDQVPAGVIISDGAGTIEAANRTAERLFGHAGGALQGRALDSLLQPAEARPAEAAVAAAAAVAAVAVRGDGASFPAEVISSELELDRQPRRITIVLDTSARKRMEQQLHQSEQLLRKVLEALPVAVCVADLDGKVVLDNPAASRICDAIMGPGQKRRPGQVWDGDSGAALGPAEWGLEKALRQGSSTLNRMIEVAGLDGSRHTLNSSAVPLFDDDGRISGAVALNTDITEARRAALALRRSQSSLANAQRIAQLGNWSHDAQGGNEEYSDEICRIFQRQRPLAESVRQLLLRHVQPEQRAALASALDEALAGRIALDGNFRFVLADGHDKSLHLQADPVFDAAGKVCGMHGIVHDITEKTLADDRLRQRAEQFRALVEHSPDLIIRFGRAAQCLYANPACERSLGRDAELLAGCQPGQLGLPEPVASLWSDAIAEVFRSTRSASIDFSMPTAAGERHFLARLVAEFAPDGQPAQVLLVARDISALKGGEAVLRESEQRLHGITSNIPGMVFQYRGDAGAARFSYVSEGALPLLGLTPAAAMAAPDSIGACIVAADRAGFHASLSQAAAALSNWQWEGRIGAGWIAGRASARRDGSESVLEGVIFNISDSKRSAEAIEQSRQLLRQLAAHMESVREEERKRIAREVHDELGQNLTALRMDVSMLRLTLGPDAELQQRIVAMTATVDRTIQTVRNVTATLRPAALDLGLTAAIEWLVQDFRSHFDGSCSMRSDAGEVTLDDSRATALFRIVQESLNNVAKHAQASAVQVSIRSEPDHVCVEVSDNGRGFHCGAGQPAGSFGLVGIRERVLMLAGELSIVSAPGQGCAITVCVPFQAC